MINYFFEIYILSGTTYVIIKKELPIMEIHTTALITMLTMLIVFLLFLDNLFSTATFAPSLQCILSSLYK